MFAGMTGFESLVFVGALGVIVLVANVYARWHESNRVAAILKFYSKVSRKG